MTRRMRDLYEMVDSDSAALVGPGIRDPFRRPRWYRLLTNPSVRAALLFRISASGGFLGNVGRNLLISFHACDVSPGASIEGGLQLPHPVGIVVGKGAVVGADVTIYQNVTIGANSRGEYPVVGRGSVLYPGAILSGGIAIGEGARIGAGVHVFRSVAPGSVVRSTSI